MKLYKKIILFSILLCCFTFIIAILIEMFNNDNHWFYFFQNLCIGIACSAFVVIVTTYIQYVIERMKIIDEIGGLVHDLLLNFIIATSPLGENEDHSPFYYKYINDKIDSILKRLYETSSQYNGFKRSNKKTIFNISKAAVLLRIEPIISDSPVFPITLDEKSNSTLRNLCSCAIEVLNDGYNKEKITKWLESGELL